MRAYPVFICKLNSPISLFQLGKKGEEKKKKERNLLERIRFKNYFEAKQSVSQTNDLA